MVVMLAKSEAPSKVRQTVMLMKLLTTIAMPMPIIIIGIAVRLTARILKMLVTARLNL